MLTVLRSLLPRSCASITPRTSAWSAVLDGSTTSTAHTEPGRVSLLLLLKFHGLFIILSVLRSNAEIIKVELGWWFDVFLLVLLSVQVDVRRHLLLSAGRLWQPPRNLRCGVMVFKPVHSPSSMSVWRVFFGKLQSSLSSPPYQSFSQHCLQHDHDDVYIGRCLHCLAFRAQGFLLSLVILHQIRILIWARRVMQCCTRLTHPKCRWYNH